MNKKVYKKAIYKQFTGVINELLFPEFLDVQDPNAP